MADQDTKLPIRSLAADANINLEEVNSNTISTGSGVVDAGTIRVSQATDVPINIDLDTVKGVAIDTDYGTPTSGTIRVASMLGVGSTAVSNANPVPVNILNSGGTNVHDYDTAAAVAAGASDTHSFTPSADFILHEIYYAASGQTKIEIQWGVTAAETTKSVAFTSKATLTGCFKLTDGQVILMTDTIKVIRTNMEPGLAQDLYSSIHGINA